MVREDDSTVLSTYKKAETSNSRKSSSISNNITAEENKKPAETVSVSDNSEILKLLSDLNARMDTLDARFIGQSETLNSILVKTESVLDRSRKSIFSKNKSV